MATVTLQRIRPFQEIQSGVLIGPVTDNLYTVNGLGQVTVDALDQANLLTQGWLPAIGGGGGGSGPTGPTGPPGPIGPTGPPGSGSLPAGGTVSQIVARDKAGNGIWHRPEASVNVEDFYPAGVTPHTGASQPLSGIFGSLGAAQAYFPFADDRTPEVDYCAIQLAIDYAFNNNLSAIFIPKGLYVIGATLFLDAPNSLRNQGSTPRWLAGTTYNLNDVILYNGVPYISLQPGNTGHVPYLIATDVGNDPWWLQYYAEAARSGLPSPLNGVNSWKPTLYGEPGYPGFLGPYATQIRSKYINMIGVIFGPSNGAMLRDFQVTFPEVTPVFGGGCLNPFGCGVVIVGTGGGASGTTLENITCTWVYSAIRISASASGGLGDNNVFRRCGGGFVYRFLSTNDSQAYINQVYDCVPSSTIGIVGFPGVVTVVGGNWSAFEEGSPCDILTISNVSAISTGTGNGYWALGDIFTPSPHAQYQNLTATVTASGNDPQLLSSAFQDGRAGVYNWFVIVTPSFGPVPFVKNPTMANAISAFGAITAPGTGGVAGPQTYHNVPITGGTGTGRIADVTVTGGGVTALKVVAPGAGYTIGDSLSASSGNIGGVTGFAVLAAQTLNLMVAPHWVDTFLGVDFPAPATPAYITGTTLQSELQAATSIYASCVPFPFQNPVAAYGAFFENANCSLCLLSTAVAGVPSIFSSGFLDADPAMGIYSPVTGVGIITPVQLCHYYAQKTIPYVWLNSDVVFDAFPWGATSAGGDPLIVYSSGGGSNDYNFINRNSASSSHSNSGPSIAFWHARGGGAQGPFYGGLRQLGAGLEQLWKSSAGVAVPTWNGGAASNAQLWGNYQGRTPAAGVRPDHSTVPTLQPQDFVILSDPQNLPPVTSTHLNGDRPLLNYALLYGGTAYKTEFLSPTQLSVYTSGAIKPGTSLFESSHDLWSYLQTLTAHDGGGPGIINGLNWQVQGQSWWVRIDQNSMTFMVPGLVIGLKTDTLNYYVVTGVYPGLGGVTVCDLQTGAMAVHGTKSVPYSGTTLYAQPYRLRCLSTPAKYTTSSITAAAGQEVLADTSAASFVLSLPKAQSDSALGGSPTYSVPVQGDKVSWFDIGGAFATHNLIIDGNGSKINGSTDNQAMAVNGSSGVAIYKNAATGWVMAAGTATAALLVTPDSNISFGGQLGSTFYPSPRPTYTLTASSGSVPWTLTGVPAWLVPSATSGTATTTPTVITLNLATIDPAVNPPGPYTATLTFKNTTTGQSTNRIVTLIVLGKQYMADGDSITVGSGTTNGGYPILYGTAAGASVTVTDQAVAGASLIHVISRQPLLDQMIGMKRPGDLYTLSVMVGTNDVCFGYTGGSRSAFMSQLAAYLDHNRSKGWYVILCTQIARGQPTFIFNTTIPVNTEMLALNAAIVNFGPVGATPHADALCDFAADSRFNPAAPNYAVNYQADQTHPTDAGQAALETIIKPFLDNSLGFGANRRGTIDGVGTAIADPLVAFDPTTLFASGETGGWWDPADNTTTFQDVAATIPATAAGQLVKRINDKSGNVNYLFEGTNPPTLKNSGTLWWLEFDGVAQELSRSFTISVPATRITAARPLTWSIGLYLWGDNGTSLIFQQFGSSPNVQMYGGAYLSSPDTNFTIGVDHVATEVLNGASSNYTTDHFTTLTGSMTSTTLAGINIATGGGGVNHTSLRWYGAISIGRLLTSTEIAHCQTFFGAKAGLVL